MREVTWKVYKRNKDIIIPRSDEQKHNKLWLFKNVGDVLDNYSTLNNNKFSNSIENLINYKWASRNNKTSIICQELRQVAFESFKPIIPKAIGQLNDVKIKYNDYHQIGSTNLINLTVYDNLYNKIDGLMITTALDNHKNLDIIVDIEENPLNDSSYRILFTALPTMFYNTQGRLLIGSKQLHILDIEQCMD